MYAVPVVGSSSAIIVVRTLGRCTSSEYLRRILVVKRGYRQRTLAFQLSCRQNTNDKTSAERMTPARLRNMRI